MKDRREDVRYRTNHMEKKTKLKALTNLAAAGVIIGIMIFSGSKTAVSALIAGAMIIASGIACILFEDVLKRLENLDKLKQELEKLKEEAESGTFDYVYQPEYTFAEYLLENRVSFSDFLDYIDGTPDPKEALQKAYADYTKSAGGRKVQQIDLVQSFLIRERRRRDVV